MRILVWGLGYVGTVSAGCLADLGNEVIGVEPHHPKVKAINHGLCAIKEPGLQELVRATVESSHFRATTDGLNLIPQSDISLICVGTPNGANGRPRLDAIENVSRDIGRGLRHISHYHVVVIRSTVFPGTSRHLVRSILEEQSGKKAGEDFGLVMNPEFLREGSAVNDFHTPSYTIIGELDKRSGELVDQLYQKINAPLKHVTLEEAELLKITNNAFHALKDGFGNEIGRLCDHLRIDSHRLMELVCEDSKLNISPAYLRPGFAFGGSCLPKDLRFITYNARRLGIEVTILDAILYSNDLQVTLARLKLQEIGFKNVGVLGLSFKPGTDDLRESPIIRLIQDLWQDGFNVLVYDPDVNPTEMLGSNLAYLSRQLPQINGILCDSFEQMLTQCEVVVISQKRPGVLEAIQKFGQRLVILDLVRMTDHPERLMFKEYRGMSW